VSFIQLFTQEVASTKPTDKKGKDDIVITDTQCKP
jgi:hypothetical protein